MFMLQNVILSQLNCDHKFIVTFPKFILVMLKPFFSKTGNRFVKTGFYRLPDYVMSHVTCHKHNATFP